MKTAMKTIAMLLVLAAPAVRAQDWALKTLEKSRRHGEWVKLKSQGRDLDVFVVYPETKGKAPAVVVIHEIFGLTDWARDLADQIAAAGAIAVAPDLLSGKGPHGGRTSDFPSVDAAREAVANLDPAGVAEDLKAAADYAKTLPSANGTLAAAGFCWGGGQAFRFAERGDLSAVYVF